MKSAFNRVPPTMSGPPARGGAGQARHSQWVAISERCQRSVITVFSQLSQVGAWRAPNDLQRHANFSSRQNQKEVS